MNQIERRMLIANYSKFLIFAHPYEKQTLSMHIFHQEFREMQKTEGGISREVQACSSVQSIFKKESRLPQVDSSLLSASYLY